MYYLYIDESGDPNDYLDPEGKVITGSSKFFTLGGIIVEENDRIHFENTYSTIMNRYFSNITLPTNFKLHYHPLRNKRPPYDQLQDQDRWRIPEDIFGAILSLNCNLLSVTIDLERHCQYYENPVNATAYALLLMLERFQYFVQENNSTGIAIYERYNAKMRKRIELEQRWLQRIPTFPSPTDLPDLDTTVRNGDPTKEIILQFADFFAYAPWIRQTTNHRATQKWNYIRLKYYNLRGSWLRTGFVEI